MMPHEPGPAPGEALQLGPLDDRWTLTPPGHGPKLAVVGGRLEDENRAVYREMHRLSRGRILILSTASGEPVPVGREILDVFLSHGFDAALSDVHGPCAAEVARRPAAAEAVREYGSVFFTGGNQALITEALAPGGVESPMLKAIRAMHAAGGLVAGSSAGAAAMSDAMILGGTSLEAASFGVVQTPELPGILLGRGLGFFPWGIVDQHFIKRGRMARLIVALAASGERRGFGVDENTALFVDGSTAYVRGEYGVFVLDMQGARLGADGRTAEGVGCSYLDDGDVFDLAAGSTIAAPDKEPVRAEDFAYAAPARSLRNVFGAYALYDLLTRLVLGDPRTYAADHASAMEAKAGISVCVQLRRLPGRSRALVARRPEGTRMSALEFGVDLTHRTLTPAQLAASRNTALARDYGVKPGAAARLIMLGSSPVRPGSALLQPLLQDCRGPFGIVAAASSTPRADAKYYAAALRVHGMEVTDLEISIDTIEKAGRDPALAARIGEMGTIILTGGNQLRLADTLLHRGEVTPVLLAIARAHAAGTTLAAVSGAAAALPGSMIAGGTSFEAFRFGVASDMGRRGLVIEEGLGVFGTGIVDQNLAANRRLGRLIVSCVEEGVRYGFGICEESGLVTNHDNSLLRVTGTKGVALVEIDQGSVELQDDNFVSPTTSVAFALPGDAIDVVAGTIHRARPVEEADAALALLVAELIEDCAHEERSDPGRPPVPGRETGLRFSALGGGYGVLHVEYARDRYAQA